MELSRVYPLGKQFIRFVISGVVAAAVGLIALYICTGIFKIWYLASSVISFSVTLIAAFILQKFWTFQSRELSVLTKQIGLSLILTILIFFLNAGLMYGLVDVLRTHYIVAQVFAYGVIGVIDFCLYKFVIFKV